ncbi:hypothetical protein GE09DRAFT_1293586 [Coniochaeta sp. 2T2.1]|nr:hypothetical protein GE09DRAFT_1293586 [Coniochaeta sp. 2T2.1]
MFAAIKGTCASWFWHQNYLVFYSAVFALSDLTFLSIPKRNHHHHHLRPHCAHFSYSNQFHLNYRYLSFNMPRFNRDKRLERRRLREAAAGVAAGESAHAEGQAQAAQPVGDQMDVESTASDTASGGQAAQADDDALLLLTQATANLSLESVANALVASHTKMEANLAALKDYNAALKDENAALLAKINRQTDMIKVQGKKIGGLQATVGELRETVAEQRLHSELQNHAFKSLLEEMQTRLAKVEGRTV